MADNNAAELELLEQQARQLSLQLEIRQLKEIHSAVAEASNIVIREENARLFETTYGDNTGDPFNTFVNRRGYLFDDPRFFYNASPNGFISMRDDREDGRYRPVFENEVELASIRGIGQFVASYFPTAINIIENLTNYTVGTGFSYEVIPAKGKEKKVPESLAADVQEAMEEFLDSNDWYSDLERELHERSREDGEYFMALKPEGGVARVEIIEAANVLQPYAPSDLERWLNIHDLWASSWTFGVHTREGRPWNPVGYHIVRNHSGSDWDYYPENDLDVAIRARTGLLEHFKWTKRNVKRGYSQFFSVASILQKAQKLLESSASGATVQSSIAWIVEHPEGVSKSSVERMISNKIAKQKNYEDRKDAGYDGARTVHVPAGQKYQAAPMSSAGTAFLPIQAALLRLAGSRFSMPEYMVSSDAGNNNYASSLVAEAPFVKSREAEQAKIKVHQRRAIWKALKISHRFGRLRKWQNIPFGKLLEWLDLKIDAPEVASRNKAEEATTNEILKKNGVLSAKTWASQAGLDFDEEQANGAQDTSAGPPGGGGAPGAGDGPPAPPSPGGNAQESETEEASGEFASKNRLAFKRAQLSIDDILNRFRGGAISRERAGTEFSMIGIGQTNAQKLLDDMEEKMAEAEDERLDPEEEAMDLAESSAPRQQLLWSENENDDAPASRQEETVEDGDVFERICGLYGLSVLEAGQLAAEAMNEK